MKRRLLIILLLLVGGAIVNVAAAWGLLLAIDPSERNRGIALNGVSHLQWEGKCWRQVGAASVLSMWRRNETPGSVRSGGRRAEIIPSWSPTGSEPPEWIATARPGAFEMDIVDARGWPSLALVSWARVRNGDFAEMTVLAGIECHWMPSRSTQQLFGHTLPTRPLWPGFAINTLFYAFILWLLFGGPFVVRRWRRIRRGLCPKCAYDLRGSVGATACPECGAKK